MIQQVLTIPEVMVLEPQLSYYGFRAYGLRGPFYNMAPTEEKTWFEGHRAHMLTPEAETQFNAAVRWLSGQQRTKVPNRRAGTSYLLKHVAEREMQRYISNGMFLAAAIALNFEHERASDQSVTAVNAYINIAKKTSKPDFSGLLVVAEGL